MNVTLNGNTYSDDNDPITGMGRGGARTRFFPLLRDLLVLAQTMAAAQVSALQSVANAPATLQPDNSGTVAWSEALIQIGVLQNTVNEVLRKRVLAQGVVTITQAAPTNSFVTTYPTVAVSLINQLPANTYSVVTEITACELGSGNSVDPAFAGRVKVTNKAVNGFTLGITGSATSATIRWTLLNPLY